MKGKSQMNAASGRSHSMRYDPIFMMECLLLKMKSNEAYHLIQKNKLLPLPHPSTIRRYISSSDCRFGFNDLALEHIKKALDGLDPTDQMGSLIWDEISMKKDLTWDPKNLEWQGIVDFGGEVPTVPNDIADHALCFMFRPYKQSWVQPFACFASKGAASGAVLYSLITKAISVLFNHKAIVRSCVCDGCSSNKTAMTMFGINTSAEKCKPFFLHPLNPDVKVYWFIDVPHALKCVRNHLMKHKIVQVCIAACCHFS